MGLLKNNEKKTCRKSCQITGFNYYHYFVQPDQRIYNVSILHTYNRKHTTTTTRENYAYNDHDLVTRPPHFCHDTCILRSLLHQYHHYHILILTTLCTKTQSDF